MMESLSVLTIVRNVSTEVVLKNKIFCVQYFFFENHAVYEKMCEKYCKSERLQMAIWRMRIACWIPNDTNTH
jgi:hypothetical protein